MMVSGLPSTVTVTVTVKEEPAVAVEGAAKLRTACGVAQLRESDIIPAIKADRKTSIRDLFSRDLGRNQTQNRSTIALTMLTPSSIVA